LRVHNMDHSWEKEITGITKIDRITIQIRTALGTPIATEDICLIEPITTQGFPHNEAVFVKREADSWITCKKSEIFNPNYKPYLAYSNGEGYAVYDKSLTLIDRTDNGPEKIEINIEKATTAKDTWVLCKEYPIFKQKDGLLFMVLQTAQGPKVTRHNCKRTE